MNCQQNILYDFAVLKLKPNKIIKKEHILKLNFGFDFKLEKTLGTEIMICGYPNPNRDPKEEQHKQYYEKANSNSASMW
jgi:hypothetical protein